MPQVFGNERTAVIEGLPSLEDSATFFQTESAGPATANLEDMQQDQASDISSDAEDAAAADMDHSDLPAPVPVKQSAGETCRLLLLIWHPVDTHHVSTLQYKAWHCMLDRLSRPSTDLVSAVSGVVNGLCPCRSNSGAVQCIESVQPSRGKSSKKESEETPEEDVWGSV